MGTIVRFFSNYFNMLTGTSFALSLNMTTHFSIFLIFLALSSNVPFTLAGTSEATGSQCTKSTAGIKEQILTVERSRDLFMIQLEYQRDGLNRIKSDLVTLAPKVNSMDHIVTDVKLYSRENGFYYFEAKDHEVLEDTLDIYQKRTLLVQDLKQKIAELNKTLSKLHSQSSTVAGE